MQLFEAQNVIKVHGTISILYLRGRNRAKWQKLEIKTTHYYLNSMSKRASIICLLLQIFFTSAFILQLHKTLIYTTDVVKRTSRRVCCIVFSSNAALY